MRRRLFNLLAGVSLLLCVAIAALWAWSYYRHYTLIVVSRQRGEINVTSGPGGLYVAAVPREAAFNFPRFISLDPAHMSFPLLDVGFAGFGYANFAFPTGMSHVVRAPLWPVVAGFALLTIVFWRKARTTTPGRCQTCGYDLRATPDRCPECGTEATAGAVG
ncbi:MAG TPA: hypothetical protein VGR35_21110 [Tepidisphaeraceae bacterium]|nr:hypothetical protein [Tepidisphaeraceae bacterium]